MNDFWKRSAVAVVDRMSTITGFPIKCHDEFEGGKKVLAFLECTEPIRVQGYDFDDFMLIGNSHDSSTGFFIGNSSKMIRCSNRFSKIFRQLQVSHTKNHDAKIDQLLRYFETYQKERKHLFNQMQRMAEIKIDASLSEVLTVRRCGTAIGSYERRRASGNRRNVHKKTQHCQ
jgi:hypothetical protein